jgi:predicted porin
MNKKLVTLAVGAALGLGAPMIASAAKVTVGGHAQVEIGSFDVSNGGFNGNVVRDENRGRILITASEKLGNGMTAIAKFEWKIDTTQGGRDTGDREALVGLKGNFGTVELGTLKFPYKYYGGVKYDPFVATILEARGNGGMSASGGQNGDAWFGHSGFFQESIGYKSPNFNGMTFWAVYSPNEDTGAGPGNSAAGRQGSGDWSLGLKYKNGPFEIGVAAFNQDGAADSGTKSTGSDVDGWKVFGKYKWGNHTFLGQYESSTNDNGAAADTDWDTWFLGYHLRSGNNTFVVQAGVTTQETSGVETDTDYLTVGLIHHLSKKTRLFGGYRNTDVSGGNETDVWSVGLRMIF